MHRLKRTLTRFVGAPLLVCALVATTAPAALAAKASTRRPAAHASPSHQTVVNVRGAGRRVH